MAVVFLALQLATPAWAGVGCVIFADSFDRSASARECPAPSGLAFKGPFLRGGVVTLTRLDETLQATSASLTTTISDDSGAFLIPDDWLNQTLEITVTGRFFDEVSNQATTEPITLTAITQATEDRTTFVSPVTTMAVGRIRALVDEGQSPQQAMAQASQETFAALFGESTELADLADIGPGTNFFDALVAFNALLMNINAGSVDAAELSQVLDLFAKEMTNGVLSSNLKSGLVVLANRVDADSVQAQLSAYYQQLGATITVPSIQTRLNEIRASNGVEVIINQLGDGSISQVGRQWLPGGSRLDLSLSPASGYLLASVTSTCGGSLNTEFNQFRIDSIVQPCEISVVFGRSVTLSFDSAGGSAIAAITQESGSAVTEPTSPTRAGYTFTGWSTDFPETMPAEDLTLVAQWSADAVTLTFDTDGGVVFPVIETVTDAPITALDDPVRSGYSFAFWEPAVDTTAPPEDRTYQAFWNPRIYTFFLDRADGTASLQGPGTFDSPLSALSPPVREGHDFLGYFTQPEGRGEQWFTADGQPTAVDGEPRKWRVAGDVTLYAHWQVKEATIIFAETANPVSFPLVDLKQDFGTDIPALPEPTRSGYQFLGWHPPLPSTMPDGATVIAPQWAVRQYTLTLISDRATATVYRSLDVIFNEALPNVDPPTRTGYSFLGWEPELPNPMWAKESTHFATWSANSYTVTFDLAGGSDGPSDLTVTFDQNPISLIDDTPTKTGFDFAGFWTEPDGQGEMYFDQGAGPVRPWDLPSDTTLYAHWTKGVFALVFDAQGGSATPTQFVAAGAEPSVPPEPTKFGHAFAGWDPDIPTSMPANPVRVAAQWTPNIHTVQLIGQNTSDNNVNVTFGATVPNITPPTLEGYTFLGYFEDRFGASSQFYDNSGDGLLPWLVDGGRDLYAHWSRNDYTLSFDLGYTPSDPSITAPGAIKQGFGSAITPPISPIREGHTFIGWDPELPEKLPASNQTHTAQWEKDTYTISFDSQGGAPVAALPVDFGEAVVAPDDPERTGFSFSAWTPALPATMPANDLAVTAEWTPKTYTITLDAQGGSTGQSSVTATYAALLPEVAAPSKAFASFAGYWTEPNGGGTQFYDARMAPTQAWRVDAATTLYALWIEDTRYTVNVVAIPAEGGSTSGTGTYADGEGVSVSATANEGYVFVAFYEADSVVADVSPYPFPAKRDRNIVARFTQPPTAPVVHVSPGAPSVNFDLVCEIAQPSVDPDGDPINYTFVWMRQADANSPAEVTEYTGQTVPALATNEGEIWFCEAYAHDGWVRSESGTCSGSDCGRLIVDDYCRDNPCRNGGVCSEDAGRGTFLCDCSDLTEWTGDRCNVLDACAVSLAAGETPCRGGFGVCVNAGGGYRCTCEDPLLACACCNGLNLEGFTCIVQGLADTGARCKSPEEIESAFGPFN